jgi:hypothetical protein
VLEETTMYIVALAWIYVVFMMSITEYSVVAGIMTFLLYGVLPLAIILYLMGTPQRKRNRMRAQKSLRDSAAQEEMIVPEKEKPTGMQ